MVSGVSPGRRNNQLNLQHLEAQQMLIDVYRLLVNCYLDVKYEFLGGMRFPNGSGAGPGGSGKPCHGCETSKDN